MINAEILMILSGIGLILLFLFITVLIIFLFQTTSSPKNRRNARDEMRKIKEQIENPEEEQ